MKGKYIPFLILPLFLILFGVFFFLSTGISQVSATADPKVWVCKYSGTPGVNEFLKPGKQPIVVSSNATGGTNVGDSFSDAQGRSFVLAEQTEGNTDSGNSYIGNLFCPEGDIPAPTNIDPIFECWEPDPENEGKYIAYFGWENKSGVEQTIPYGEYNEITPSTYQSYFPTYFDIPTDGPRPGRTPYYPNAAIIISGWDGNNIVWKLTDQGTETAGLTGPRCPEPVLEPLWTLSKTVGDKCVVIEGETYAQGSYTITIQNEGTGGGSITHIIDELDGKVLEAYIDSISDEGEYDNGKIVWDFDKGLYLDPNSSEQYTYTILIPEEAYGTYENTAIAYSYPSNGINGTRVLEVGNGLSMPVEVARDSVTVDLECDIEKEEEEEEEVIDDEPEVLGEETKVEEKKIEEVGVVLAQTGSESNIFVYVIQTLLSLSTILSGIFFSKKYIM